MFSTGLRMMDMNSRRSRDVARFDGMANVRPFAGGAERSEAGSPRTQWLLH